MMFFPPLSRLIRSHFLVAGETFDHMGETMRKLTSMVAATLTGSPDLRPGTKRHARTA